MNDSPRRQEQFLERSLPSSEESERAILGGILLDNHLISDAVDSLVPEDFYGPLHKRIYTAMLALFERSVKIDPIMIGEELKKGGGSLDAIGGIATIANLTYGLPQFTNVDEYIATVKEKSRARKLVQICGFTHTEALSEIDDFANVLDRHEQLISELRNKDTANQFTPIRDSVQKVFERVQNFGNSRDEGDRLLGITTGFRDLDAATSGFERGDLIVLGARPSMGKTSLAMGIARRAAGTPDKPIIPVFSLEMTEEQLTQRLLASEASIDLTRLRQGMLTRPEWVRLAEATKSLAALGIRIDDTPGITTMQMKAKLRRLLSEEKKLDMVVVDHMDLVKHPDYRKERRFQLKEIAQDMKAMAKEFGIPFLALHHLSREVEKRKPPKPMMSDLRESGSIEEIADIVMFIYRPEYYLKDNTPDEQRGIAEIIIDKNRNGPTLTHRLAFLKHFARFEDAYIPL